MPPVVDRTVIRPAQREIDDLVPQMFGHHGQPYSIEEIPVVGASEYNGTILPRWVNTDEEMGLPHVFADVGVGVQCPKELKDHIFKTAYHRED